MYLNDDVEVGNREIREDIERDVTWTDSGNCRETQNANIKIYICVTWADFDRYIQKCVRLK